MVMLYSDSVKTRVSVADLVGCSLKIHLPPSSLLPDRTLILLSYLSLPDVIQGVGSTSSFYLSQSWEFH